MQVSPTAVVEGRVIDWMVSDFGGVPTRPTACAGNLRAVQVLLRHSKLASTVRYLGIEVDEAPSISEQTEI